MVFVEPWRGVTNSPDVAVGAVAGSLMIAAMIPYSPAPDKGRIKAMGRTSAGSSAIVVKRPQKTNNHIDDFTPPQGPVLHVEKYDLHFARIQGGGCAKK
ncbi:MAG: hypothetical protein PVI89_08900 [Desulfobacteraceae bacterium]|jgi:hypothetical protein